MVETAEGAFRRRTVPDYLAGKRATSKAVLEWARAQLNGEEPDLSQDDLRRIKSGEDREVILRPRKAGFFLPTGEFVEAFDTTLQFGEDLGGHEKEWDATEADWRWADAENRVFNKSTAVAGRGIGRQLWEHGKRIVDYSKENKRPASQLLHLLDRRKPATGYGRRTHQTCLDFYRWKPDMHSVTPLWDWSWERVDAVLRFSNQDQVRDVATLFLADPALSGLSDVQITRLLARKQRSEPRLQSAPEEAVLEEARKALKHREIPDATTARRVRQILDGV